MDFINKYDSNSAIVKQTIARFGAPEARETIRQILVPLAPYLKTIVFVTNSLHQQIKTKATTE
jgi:hypothetical protein